MSTITFHSATSYVVRELWTRSLFILRPVHAVYELWTRSLFILRPVHAVRELWTRSLFISVYDIISNVGSYEGIDNCSITLDNVTEYLRNGVTKNVTKHVTGLSRYNVCYQDTVQSGTLSDCGILRPLLLLSKNRVSCNRHHSSEIRKKYSTKIIDNKRCFRRDYCEEQNY